MATTRIHRVQSFTERQTFERVSLQLSLNLDVNRGDVLLYPVIYRLFVDESCDEFKRGDHPICHTDPARIDGNRMYIWGTHFHVNYYFERRQKFQVEIKEAPTELIGTDFENHPTVATCTFTLGDLMNTRERIATIKLEGPAAPGSLRIKGEVVHEANDFMKMTLRVSNLRNRNLLRGLRPFIVISKSNEDGEVAPVWQNTPEPAHNGGLAWGECTIPIAVLCNADPYRPILFEVFDDRSGSGHLDNRSRLLGWQKTNLDELKSRSASHFVLYLDEEQPSLRANPNVNNRPSLAGQDSDGEEDLPRAEEVDHMHKPCIIVTHPRVERSSGIMEYIIGGCVISLVVGIDFTESNRLQQLHQYYTRSTTPGVEKKFNPYEKAILSVAKILEQYDFDKKYPVYGFGGEPPKTGRERYPNKHCFTLHPPDQEVDGVNGILQAYRAAIATSGENSVKLSSPTLFSHVLGKIASKVEAVPCDQDHQHYTILLMLTDDPNGDVEQTMKQLVKASKLPMSIIFIGVGNSDFSAFQNYTTEKLAFEGDYVARKAVSFFKMNDLGSQGRISETVLREIPEQFLEYMKSQSIRPN